MNKKPFQIRLDSDRLDRLARVAAAMQMSKTDIVESGIDMRLDLLEGYQKMDRAEPKKRLMPAETKAAAKMPLVRANVRALAETIQQRSGVAGWDAEGNPIYRGVK